MIGRVTRRLKKDEAIVLNAKRFGEIHKNVQLLTRNHGLIYATAFGAAKGKSRLAGIITPFAEIRLDLYFEPVKGMYKIEDGRPVHINEALHESLPKYYGAHVIAELLVKSYAGGESSLFFHLTSKTLEVLNSVNAHAVPYVIIQYLWKYLDAAGFSPDISCCRECGKSFENEAAMCYSTGEHGFFCSRCAGAETIKLPRGGVIYLLHTRKMDLQNALRVETEGDTVKILIKILTDYIESILEEPLQSIPMWLEMV
jgi:DNA repair protein RecO (recombination protein O)